MAKNVTIESPVKVITSGNAPDKTKLGKGQMAFGTVNGKKRLYGSDGTNVYELNQDIDLSGYVEKAQTATSEENGAMSASDKSNLDALVEKNYPFDIASFSVAKALIGVGDTVPETLNLTWSYSNADRNPVSSQKLTVGSGATAAVKTIPVGTTSENIASSIDTASAKTIPFKLDVSTSTGKTKSKSLNGTVQNYSYYGTVDGGVSVPTVEQVKALTKDLRNSKGKTGVRINQANNKGVFAYPASLGDLSSIKNSSGFEGIGGWTKNEVTVDGVKYNVYVTNIAATANDTYTFA